MTIEYQGKHLEVSYVSESSPCLHCGKPDWCYVLSNGLNLCNRQVEPAEGWYRTKGTDKQNKFFYAPQNNKVVSPKQTKHYYYPDREGNKFIRVTRKDNGQGKKQLPQAQWKQGKWVYNLDGVKRDDIPIYRYTQIKKALANHEKIFVVEGEKCADALWKLGLPATTNIGGGKKWNASDTQDLTGAHLVLCPDRDKPGVEHMLRIAEDFPNAQWLYAPPSDFFWQTKNLSTSKGLDIYDWIETDGVTKDDILAAITHRAPTNLHKNVQDSVVDDRANLEINLPMEGLPEVEEMYTQKAIDALYGGGHYIALHDKLYHWTGTHYEFLSTPREKRRIAQWCKSTPLQVAGGKWKYTLATPAKIETIWNWALTDFAVDPEEVNPPGINCLNGVIKITWEGRKPSWKLVEHSPEHFYTHVANINYDPGADDRDCNRMLAALERPQQDIFLRTIAASLDLKTIRKYRGRAVKALLCQGTGSNGKDTLREAVRMILGDGMTSASVTDFKQYDEGRKFPLCKLESAQINWASENSHFARLDGLQGLKAAITGETIDIEPKNGQEYPITPRTVFLFNVNEAPLLEGGMDAITSRWSILSFTKIFKQNADITKGELEADSRFRYDPDFLEKNVCPALLNKILLALVEVAKSGVDYASTSNALQQLQEESNHLWAFTQDQLSQTASAPSAVDDSVDTASAVSSAVSSATGSAPIGNVTYRQESTTKTSEDDFGSQNVTVFNFVNAQENTASNDRNVNALHHDKLDGVKWVKLKDGRIMNVTGRQGLKLEGRQSGMRKYETFYLDECTEIHYEDNDVRVTEDSD